MPYGASRCPSCGLSLEGPLAARLFTALSTADDLLRQMRETAVVAAPAAPAAPTQAAPVRPAGALATLTRPPSTTTPPGPPPTAEAPRHGGLGGASVPKILLALGALCLLVAALVFLAVAWSAMGVAGRTATLVGFTVVAGALCGWAAHRDLRAAAESLGVVALGLLAFDLFGARDAGWLGDLTTAEFAVVLGVVVALAGAGAATAVRRTPARALVGAEVIATLGVACAVAGLATADWFAWSAALTVAVVLAASVAVAAYATRLMTLAVGAGLVTISTWVLLLISSWDRAAQNPSLGELWLDLEVWPLLVAAALVGALAFVPRLPLAARLTGLAIGSVVLASAVLAPFTDETLTAGTAAGAALLAVLCAVALAVRPPWRRSLGAPVGLLALWMLVSGVTLAVAGLERIADAGGALWAGGSGDAFPARVVGDAEMASWLLPVTVVATAAALVTLARTYSLADRLVAPLTDLDVVLAGAALTTALTLALYPVPMWLVALVLLATGAGFVAATLRRQHALPLAMAVLFLGLGLMLALHAEWLTLATLVVVLVATVAVHLRSTTLEVSVGAGALASAAAAGLAWTVCAVAGAPDQWTAVAALLVLAAIVLGAPFVDQRVRVSGPATYARLGIELGALLAAAVVSTAAVELAADESQATWFAVYLTLTGATVSAMALLRPDRRMAGWLGGFLLAAASWVRLADIGVETPEAYTLPSAVALLAVGHWHLRHNRATSTMAALTPGLGLALVPSLLWVFADPIALRSVLLGLACLALVVGGVRLRWAAPLVHGAVVGTLLVLRLATPVAEAVPRWALIGAAGALLVAMGITWEKRVRDARAVAGYVRGLR